MQHDKKQPPQRTVLYVHVRRDLVEAGEALEVLLADVNEKVSRHGAVVLANGQFLRRPIVSNWDVEPYLTDDTTEVFEHLPREWGRSQAAYFQALWGFVQPYQYAAEADAYDRYCVAALDPSPYLVDGEKILALVEAGRDEHYLHCPCHVTQMVYTSRHRLVCMGCGHLHCVLEAPIRRDLGTGLTGAEWDAAIDADGEIVDDGLALPIIDYREVEPLPKLWVTDAWSEATWLIDFYATASAEEIADYERGLPSPEDFMEAGWSQVPTPPSVTAQLSKEGYGFDITQNAAAALNAGAAAYSRGKSEVEALRDAVLQVFHAVELILKIRLEQVEPGALSKRPNNPTVVERLRAAGIAIASSELQAIEDLRVLRNHLQHAGARYSYRDTRRLIRSAFAFLDRFSVHELGWWIGEVIEPPGWSALLNVESIRSTAEAQAVLLLKDVEGASGDIVIRECPFCGRRTLVRASRFGSLCVFCRHKPTLQGFERDE